MGKKYRLYIVKVTKANGGYHEYARIAATKSEILLGLENPFKGLVKLTIAPTNQYYRKVGETLQGKVYFLRK